MSHINYKSDFSRIIRLKDLAGTDIGWPSFDWTATFWAYSKAMTFTASCIGGVCTNCRRDDNRIRVVFNGHGLGVGLLKVEFCARLPRGVYPDGTETVVQAARLSTVLTADEVHCLAGEEETVVLPFIYRDAPGADSGICAPSATWTEVRQVIDGLFDGAGV